MNTEESIKLYKTNLLNCFTFAGLSKAKYVGVKIRMIGFEADEIIINERANFKSKLAYYMKAYNDDLELKTAPDKIRIVGFTYGNSFEEIERDLLG